jgi:GNAT superfamily N-acetyltransferase
MEIEISAKRNSAFEKIAWNIFFESKQRGVSFDRHFPWIFSGLNNAWYLIAKSEGDVIGGLVIKEKICSLDNKAFKLGLIGLVCVTTEFRGRGIAAKLIQEANAFVKAKKLDALTLWTSKPEVYEKHGFVGRDPWLYGSVNRTDTIINRSEPFEIRNNHRQRLDIALPPFALSISEYFDDQSTALVVQNSIGCILMEYSGKASKVAAMLATQMPPSWRINVTNNDPLIEQLLHLGLNIAVQPSNLQMWFCLNKNYTVDTIAKLLIVPPLERI